WVYLPQFGQYTVKDAAPLTTAGSPTNDIGNAMAVGTPIQRYLSIKEGLRAASIQGEESVEIEGKPVRCTVVRAQYATPDSTRLELSPNTFWIDAPRRLVVRDSLQVRIANGPNGAPVTMATVTTFRKLETNATLPDTLFTFHPPEGAQKVDQFSQ